MFCIFTAFGKVGGEGTLWDRFAKFLNGTLNNTSNMTMMGSMTMMGNTTKMCNMTMGNMTMMTTCNKSIYTGCFSMTPYWGNMFRPASDPEYPWIGLWVALPIIGVWYWCTDQVSTLVDRWIH